MHYKKEDFIKILKYHIKHGKRKGNESYEEWILRKRSINIAFRVLSAVEGMDFVDFELALYFRCDDKTYQKFIRTYEAQMEDAILHPDRFVENLHNFI